MNNQYITIKNQEISFTNEINKSTFIGYAKGVSTVEEATEFVASIRKRHFDATHNCYAYIVDDRAKFSDDGEPQGTAGMPIYDCIKKLGLNRVCVVVTRYFGGIKLGAGGLVRAYSGACADVLRIAERVEMRQCTIVDIVLDYSLLKPVKRALTDKMQLLDTIYDSNVTLRCLILSENLQNIQDNVVQNSLGKATMAVKEHLICPYEQ